MADSIRVSQMPSGGYLQKTDKLYAVRGSGVGADKYVTIPLITDEYNTVLGDNALSSALLSGTFNVAIGTNAASKNTNGTGNIAIGSNAIADNTTGDNNVAIGYLAGYTLEAGTNNILLGIQAVTPTSTTSDFLNIGGALNGTVGTTKSLNSVGNFTVATDRFAVNAVTGDTGVLGTFHSTGNLSVNSGKFIVAAATGNTTVAGTLGVTGAVTGASYSGGAISGTTGAFSSTLGSTGNFAVNTNKFTVAATTGNTLVAGTLGVTGATTLSTLGTSGAATLNSLVVTAGATVGTTLAVTGAITGGSYSGGIIAGSSGNFGSTMSVAGNFSVNTNKFTVAASTGNTLVAGTLGITGVTTTSSDIFLSSAASSGKVFRIEYGGTLHHYLSQTAVAFLPAYTNTSASAANVVVDASGGLSRSTSSRKFKENERPLEMNTSKIDEVVSCTFNMKDSGQLGHGPISEDIALVEPNFATYDLEGAPEAIHTNNLLYALIVEHQKLKQTVSALEQRLAKLEAK